MSQAVNYKSDFDTFKLTMIRLVLFSGLVSPWLILLVQFDKIVIAFASLVNLLIFAVIMYHKVPLRVIIYQEEPIIEYYWMRIWSKKHLVSINIKNASFYLDTINVRGSELSKLIIIDNNDRDKKISLTEITDGFNNHEICYIHQTLKRINAG